MSKQASLFSQRSLEKNFNFFKTQALFYKFKAFLWRAKMLNLKKIKLENSTPRFKISFSGFDCKLVQNRNVLVLK